jgi:hypothetical protein
MEALWRRIVFNIMIFITDDHLRNHGLLYGFFSMKSFTGCIESAVIATPTR